MTPAKLMRIANQAENFNQRAAALDETSRNLGIERDALIMGFRDMGMLVAEAEEMVAKVSCRVTLPEPDTDDQPQDAGRQDGEPAADGDAEAA